MHVASHDVDAIVYSMHALSPMPRVCYRRPAWHSERVLANSAPSRNAIVQREDQTVVFLNYAQSNTQAAAMNAMDPQTLTRFVSLNYGVELGDADAARLLAVSNAVRTTVALIAAESLFDSEPANLQSTLEELADVDADPDGETQ